ncbi:MAG TPA: RnfABCDGE type electron transport complex subunit G [Spirochaetota bacterium]|nr:RnfABCDGE type electron transport complex subunit G [Spirochaetota bacterium]HPS87637.1 RnfABCDGE type electron transport complex subunit G [Spirochaetota bacterium]
MAHTDHNNNSMFKITLNLTMATLLAGIIIGVVYYFTAPIAEIQRIRQKEQSMKELVPDAASFVEIEGKHEWFKAEKDGKVIAYLVLTHQKGFDGHIKLFVAATPDKKVIGYKVLSHRETPGLGDQAFKPKFAGQFTGKGLENMELVKIQEEGKILAITGATITSRAVTAAVKNVLTELGAYLSETNSEVKNEAKTDTKNESK